VMQTPLGIPILLRRVGLHGPKGIREIDMILDTGAVYTWRKSRPMWERRERVCRGGKGVFLCYIFSTSRLGSQKRDLSRPML